MYLDTGLIIRGGAENLALGGGNGRVARDEGGGDATKSLDAKGKRGDIKQQDFFDFPLKYSGLNRVPSLVAPV
jgi:hypothetical protein